MNKTDGNIYDSKMLWALGQYSWFIRPGMKRVETGLTGDKVREDINDDVLVSAYKTIDNKKLVVVIVNLNENTEKLKFNLAVSKYKLGRMYRTSQNPGENILPIGYYKPTDVFPIVGRSVTTIEFL